MNQRATPRKSNPVSYQDAVERANQLYREFHQKEPDQDIFLALPWPDRFGVEAKATITSYYSNKWHKKKKWTSYIHPHDRPLPVLLQPWRPGLRVYGRHFTQPKAIAFLGYALDVQLDRDPVSYLDFKGDQSLPYLAGDPDRHLLIIIPQDLSSVRVLWSPVLRITEKGIEG